MTRLGMNKLSSSTSSSATLPNRVSTKPHRRNKSKEATDRIWVPPKPSYNRTHRLVSMSSIGDSDIEAETNLQTKVSRQVTVTRPSRFRSLRKLTLRNRPGGAPCRQASSSTRRRAIGVFKRLSCHPHYSAPPAPPGKPRTKALAADYSSYSEFSPAPKTFGGLNERCDDRVGPEKQVGSESSKVEYFETVILQLTSHDHLETNQYENTTGIIPWLTQVASSRRKSNPDLLEVEMDGMKKFNRKASKSL
ncbi:hypothetical protein PtA15_8A779 [Puccinia triticina]|nr:uncharacterized protein PtA15_8A779 [Puccinia triticina]WAQ87872.1 hypothetical protein PtA15_8A779 [Puccinia triticina]